MEPLVKIGRIFFGVSIAALGIQQFFYPDFNPVVLPADSATWLPGSNILVFIWGASQILAGLAIIFEKKARTVTLILGGIFFALFLFCQVPHLLFINPYGNILGVWTRALKELAFSGAAFGVAGSFGGDQSAIQKKSSLVILLERGIPLGPSFFAITMIVFGYDHFYYLDFVAPLVPDWIPSHIFWTYFAGVALIGSGVALITKVKLKLVALLLGTMIFLWFIFLHIPRAIADPFGDHGNELTSVFQALGFSGAAFVFAYGAKQNKPTNA